MAQKRVKHNGNALLDKAYRYESNGWVFVHVEGQPFERGYQHGYLLAREIQDALRVSKFLAHWDTGEDFEVFVKAALQLFPARVDQEYLDEMQGIAQGARMAGIDISFDEILTWNGYQELLGNWWPNNMGSIPSTKRWKGKKGHHCSAFIATGKHTKDGRIVMAHNTWDRYASGDHYNIILDILPASGNRILMQAVPGYISSTTDFWETSAGLMITETTIAGVSSFDPEPPRHVGDAPEHGRRRGGDPRFVAFAILPGPDQDAAHAQRDARAHVELGIIAHHHDLASRHVRFARDRVVEKRRRLPERLRLGAGRVREEGGQRAHVGDQLVSATEVAVPLQGVERGPVEDPPKGRLEVADAEIVRFGGEHHGGARGVLPEPAIVLARARLHEEDPGVVAALGQHPRGNRGRRHQRGGIVEESHHRQVPCERGMGDARGVRDETHRKRGA